MTWPTKKLGEIAPFLRGSGLSKKDLCQREVKMSPFAGNRNVTPRWLRARRGRYRSDEQLLAPRMIRGRFPPGPRRRRQTGGQHPGDHPMCFLGPIGQEYIFQFLSAETNMDRAVQMFLDRDHVFLADGD